MPGDLGHGLLRQRGGLGRLGFRQRHGLNDVEVAPQLGRALVAVGRLALHRPDHDVIEARIESGHLGRGRLPRALGQVACEHLIEHHAHRVEIGAGIDVGPEDQRLGRHVIGRAQGHPRHRQPVLPGIVDLGEAEVGHLHLAVGVDEYIGRLDVAVDDAQRMRGGERIADMGGNGVGVLGGESSLTGDHLLNVGAVDVFHHEKELAVPSLAKVEHRDDGRMEQPGHDLRLIAEALRIARVFLLDAPGQDLDGHRSVETFLDSLVDGPHPATAQQ